MTDERQTLDSDLSTATAEPPAAEPEAAEPQAAAASEPEAGAAEPQAQAAPGGEREAEPQAQAGEGEGEGDRTVQAEGGGEVEAERSAEPAGSEGKPVAAGGEDESAVTTEPAGDEGETVVGAAGGGEDVPATETAQTADEEGAPQAAAGEVAAEAGAAATAGAEGEPLAAVGEVAGEEEAQAAAAVAEPATGAQAQEPAAEGSADAQAAETATPLAETAPEAPPQAESTTAGAAGAVPAETTTLPVEPSAAATTDGASPAAAAATTTPPVEPSAAPTAGDEAATEPAAPPTAQAQDSPAPAVETAAGPAAETPAPAAQAAEPAAPAAEAPPTAPEPEEPEDPALAALREAREKGTPVEGRVIGWNRGGFHVVVGEVTAFCPSSEMEVGRPKSPQSYMEKTFSFKVIKYQKKGRRVVLSRAAVLGEKRQQVIAELAPGAIATGRVTSLPDFGAFVDLGGVEGLVHVSEISRGRVQHPKDALQIGQEVEVKVLKVEQDGERISLSMKDLEPDPWQGAGQRFGRGDRFSGKVLRKTDFGLFVELEPEVEGLLHVSQLPPGKSMEDAEYQPGQPLEGWVREVETKRQRISLTLREVPTDDPWKSVTQRFPEGESVEGTVESIAPFGVFVTLAPGITGLLPNSQTGLPRGTNAARAFTPGQTVRVRVLSVDTRRKRISLGREGAHVEASKNDLQDFKRREREREREKPTAMAAAFARLREERDEP